MKVLIAAGGSGGHLFPAQQLADMLMRKGHEVLFAGYKLSHSPFFLKNTTFNFVEIPASPLARMSFPFALAKGFWKSWKTIQKFDPEVVVGFGSYHVFPVLLASLKRKMILFEANSELGKVNRFFAPFAKVIATQFPIEKGTLVPLLPWISHNERWEEREARREYHLDPDQFTFLVFGGSQGADFLNKKIPEAIAQLKAPVQVIHFTGKEEAETKNAYEKFKIRAYVKSFENEMKKAFAAASCAICRSGAGTIADLIQHQMPALLIPFPESSEDHQRKNGEYLASRQAARLLIQKEANLDRITEEIEKLILEKDTKKLFLQKLDLQNMNRSDFVDLVEGVVL